MTRKCIISAALTMSVLGVFTEGPIAAPVSGVPIATASQSGSLGLQEVTFRRRYYREYAPYPYYYAPPVVTYYAPPVYGYAAPPPAYYAPPSGYVYYPLPVVYSNPYYYAPRRFAPDFADW